MSENNLDYIIIKGARENNLKNLDLKIPRNKLIVISGVSGSGKSSLAFGTIYSEGQRRYLESLSTYTRQFLNLQDKPLVTSIVGLAPAIAIDQKSKSKNPRSTVGTITEINDYVRLMYASIGIPFSPVSKLPIKSQTITEMLDSVLTIPKDSIVQILAPIAKKKKGEFVHEFDELRRKGLENIIIDGKRHNISKENLKLQKNVPHAIHVIVDTVTINPSNKERILEALESALNLAKGVVEIHIESTSKDENKTIFFSQHYSCPISGFQIPNIEPQLFSFNSIGGCEKCKGIGEITLFDPDLIVPDKLLSINQGALEPFQTKLGEVSTLERHMHQCMKSLGSHYNFSLDVPFGALPKNIQNIIFFGSDEEIEFQLPSIAPMKKIKSVFKGIVKILEEHEIKYAHNIAVHNKMNLYKITKTCPECQGYRLKKEVLCIKINNLHIGELLNLDLTAMYNWIKDLPNHLNKTEKTIVSQIIKEIRGRLEFLSNVGLDYLTLSRKASTLSGGESQRIRLASQIGSGLQGVMYVLDEPSIGLHQRDNQRLIDSLIHLKNLGNTVFVVEHDEETIMSADHIIDIGPGAGIYGGQVLAEGSPQEVLKNPKSITASYLNGSKKIKSMPVKTDFKNFLEIKGVKTHNLKNVSVKIPIGALSVVTGVSGSGKSSLILDTLCPAVQSKLEYKKKLNQGIFESISGTENFSRLIEIDQSPIGRTPRSNPATYIGLFDIIRNIFAELPKSKMRGYKPGRFSFNVKGGRCETCNGDGMIKKEMHFMHDIYVKCAMCDGKRYNRETLEVQYRGKSISDILNLTVDQAVNFFKDVPNVYNKVSILDKVGLGYLQLGQSSTTLSGGESQRIKLSKELSNQSFSKTLYILDEPTTGLHFADINNLMSILYDLVEVGNTVVIIEHNLDVIARADYIIDIGKGGGKYGGEVVDMGSTEKIMQNKASLTGHFLKQHIAKEKKLQKKNKK